MTEQYHDAPHTLDADREIPEDAAPSAGHDDEGAERVRERDQKFTEGVKEEAERVAEHGETGPQDPANPEVDQETGEQRDTDEDTDASDPSSDSDDEDESDVPDGTVNEVLDWVGDDHERAQRALEVERSGQNRQTLISELQKR